MRETWGARRVEAVLSTCWDKELVQVALTDGFHSIPSCPSFCEQSHFRHLARPGGWAPGGVGVEHPLRKRKDEGLHPSRFSGSATGVTQAEWCYYKKASVEKARAVLATAAEKVYSLS